MIDDRLTECEKVVFSARVNHAINNVLRPFFFTTLLKLGSNSARQSHVPIICRISIMGDADGFHCFIEPNI